MCKCFDAGQLLFGLREGKVRMGQMNLRHPSAPANLRSLAKRDARGSMGGLRFQYNAVILIMLNSRSFMKERT